MMHKQVWLLLIIWFMQWSTAAAGYWEWQTPKFRFTGITRVLLHMPVLPAELEHTQVQRDLEQMLRAKTKHDGSLEILDFTELSVRIKRDTGVDLAVLYQHNPRGALEQLNAALPHYADIIMAIEVLEYGYGAQYYEGYTYDNREYRLTKIQRDLEPLSGHMIDKTRSIAEPAKPVCYVSIGIDVYAAATETIVYSRLDDRLSVAGSGEAVPDLLAGLYGRAIDDWFETLTKKAAPPDIVTTAKASAQSLNDRPVAPLAERTAITK